MLSLLISLATFEPASLRFERMVLSFLVSELAALGHVLEPVFMLCSSAILFSFSNIIEVEVYHILGLSG
jgi:hypothetical protein